MYVLMDDEYNTLLMTNAFNTESTIYLNMTELGYI